MFWFKHANTRKHVSEQSWLSGWSFLNILAHLAHLAQLYFSLIFSAINTYNCSWFDLASKKICSHWRQKLVEKWPMLTTFFLTATAAITDICIYIRMFIFWGVPSPLNYDWPNFARRSLVLSCVGLSFFFPLFSLLKVKQIRLL